MPLVQALLAHPDLQLRLQVRLPESVKCDVICFSFDRYGAPKVADCPVFRSAKMEDLGLLANVPSDFGPVCDSAGGRSRPDEVRISPLLKARWFCIIHLQGLSTKPLPFCIQ